MVNGLPTDEGAQTRRAASLTGWQGETLALVLCLAVACGPATQPDPYVAPNAPQDRPVTAPDQAASDALWALLEPCSRQAVSTYPAAKRRFLAGLGRQESFFVTIRLVDSLGRWEQVFVAVDRIANGEVTGRIWNPIHTVEGYHQGQTVVVPEAEVLDWTISRPDGTEEGNYVGKAIDELQAGRLPVCAN